MAMLFGSIARRSSTSRTGSSFLEQMIQAVWNKAVVVSGADPNILRKDVCGAWIRRSEYGKTTEYGSGWEIDHIQPVSSDGADVIGNLQPLQWQNNREKGDKWPVFPMQYAKVVAK